MLARSAAGSDSSPSLVLLSAALNTITAASPELWTDWLQGSRDSRFSSGPQVAGEPLLLFSCLRLSSAAVGAFERSSRYSHSPALANTTVSVPAANRLRSERR